MGYELALVMSIIGSMACFFTLGYVLNVELTKDKKDIFAYFIKWVLLHLPLIMIPYLFNAVYLLAEADADVTFAMLNFISNLIILSIYVIIFIVISSFVKALIDAVNQFKEED